MHVHSFPQSERDDTDKAADKAAFSEVEVSEIEAVTGGWSLDGAPGCGTYPRTHPHLFLNPQPLPTQR